MTPKKKNLEKKEPKTKGIFGKSQEAKDLEALVEVITRPGSTITIHGQENFTASKTEGPKDLGHCKLVHIGSTIESPRDIHIVEWRYPPKKPEFKILRDPGNAHKLYGEKRETLLKRKASEEAT